MRYSAGFKRRMVEKMAGPEGLSAKVLSQEVGVHQTTLSSWLREAVKVDGMTKKKTTDKRPEDRTPSEKFGLVSEASKLEEEQLGSFLRERGVHRIHLETWRQQMLAGLEAQQRRQSAKKRTAEGRRVRELERELRRKDKALAEAAALLVLKKKAQAIWGDEDDDTAPRSVR
jgi:transposase